MPFNAGTFAWMTSCLLFKPAINEGFKNQVSIYPASAVCTIMYTRDNLF